MINIKSKLKKICIAFIPDAILIKRRLRKQQQGLAENFEYDKQRFLRHSSVYALSQEYHYVSRVIAHYHVLEKGLAMPECRLGFGQNIALSLIKLLNTYMDRKYNTSNIQFQAALKTLGAYVDFHVQNHEALDDIASQFQVLKQKASMTCDSAGGIQSFSRQEIVEGGLGDFRFLSRTRHSIRNYTPCVIPRGDIEDAVRMAQTTPSVCNRQSCKAYVISDADLKEKVLALQTGNRGFGHLADKIIIVASDLRAFAEIGERNQGFVDSGMFGMSLLYALHYKGLGACTLNWSVEWERDQKLHQLLDIPDHEIISMLITVGCLPDQIKVACSQRKNLEDALVFLPVNE